MAPRRVFVVGVGMTPFTKPKSEPAEGPHWNTLGVWAVERALEDAAIDKKLVEWAACGTMFNLGAGQRILCARGPSARLFARRRLTLLLPGTRRASRASPSAT